MPMPSSSPYPDWPNDEDGGPENGVKPEKVEETEAEAEAPAAPAAASTSGSKADDVD